MKDPVPGKWKERSEREKHISQQRVGREGWQSMEMLIVDRMKNDEER
jgi:hypothetical protein